MFAGPRSSTPRIRPIPKMRRPATASPALPLPALTDTPAKSPSVEQRAQIHATPLAAPQVKKQMNGSSSQAIGMSPGMAEVQAAFAKRRQELTLQALSPGKAPQMIIMNMCQILYRSLA